MYLPTLMRPRERPFSPFFRGIHRAVGTQQLDFFANGDNATFITGGLLIIHNSNTNWLQLVSTGQVGEGRKKPLALVHIQHVSLPLQVTTIGGSTNTSVQIFTTTEWIKARCSRAFHCIHQTRVSAQYSYY